MIELWLQSEIRAQEQFVIYTEINQKKGGKSQIAYSETENNMENMTLICSFYLIM